MGTHLFKDIPLSSLKFVTARKQSNSHCKADLILKISSIYIFKHTHFYFDINNISMDIYSQNSNVTLQNPKCMYKK